MAVPEYDCNYSKFKLSEHIKKYPHYLEVIIDNKGRVHYAHPSHQEKLISMMQDTFDLTRQEVSDRCPPQRYFDFVDWMCEELQAICVYTTFYNPVSITNIAQLKTLRRLKISGAYEGEITHTIGRK